MNDIANVLHVGENTLFGLALLFGVLIILRLLWLAAVSGRRRQLVVAKFTNVTGHPELDCEAFAAAQQVRESLVREFLKVRQRAQYLLQRAGIESGGRVSPLAPPQSQVVASLQDLASSVRTFAPGPVGPTAQAAIEVMLRPTGTRVDGQLLSHGESDSIGLGLELVDLRGQERAVTFSLWSHAGDHPSTDSANVGVESLVRPMTRILAIELLRQDLLRRPSRRIMGGQARARWSGRVSRFIGLIYQASALSYPAHAPELYGRALDALTEAVQHLPDDYEPLKDLGDTFAFLGGEGLNAADKHDHVRDSVLYYERAEAVARKLPGDSNAAAIRAVRVGRAVAQFRSSDVGWVADASATANALLRDLEPANPTASRAASWDAAREEDEILLYNAACLLSLEYDRSPGDGQDRSKLAHWAGRLLVYALARDRSPDRNLWALSEEDNDLTPLRKNCGLDTSQLVQAIAQAQRNRPDWSALLREPDELQRIAESFLAKQQPRVPGPWGSTGTVGAAAALDE